MANNARMNNRGGGKRDDLESEPLTATGGADGDVVGNGSSGVRLTEEQIAELRRRNKPYDTVKSVAICLAALWGLHGMHVYHSVLRSPAVRHGWFRAGLAASVAILIIKSYVELYEGKTKRQTINYENFRQTTHAIIFLILFAWVAFLAALWPAYGGLKSFFILFMFGYGVLLQLCLLIPTWAQNALGAVLMTLFLQQYA